MLGALLLLLAMHAATLAVATGRHAAAAAPEVTALRIDPNVATQEELMLLPGIGPALSANIIEYRERAAVRPAFRQAADLQAVHRIGPVISSRLAPYLSFDSSTDTIAAAKP